MHQRQAHAQYVHVRLLTAADEGILENVAPDVFDNEVNPQWSAAFLADPCHHLAVALDDGLVVGMASAVHYVHPDKPPELWVNEVGVAPAYRQRGLGRQLLDALFEQGKELGCVESWVLTEAANTAARRLYERAGGEASEERPVYYTFRL